MASQMIPAFSPSTIDGAALINRRAGSFISSHHKGTANKRITISPLEFGEVIAVPYSSINPRAARKTVVHDKLQWSLQEGFYKS